MNEHKEIKVSLTTFFLAIAIIIILVMAFFLYNINSEKTNLLKETKELEQ